MVREVDETEVVQPEVMRHSLGSQLLGSWGRAGGRAPVYLHQRQESYWSNNCSVTKEKAWFEGSLTSLQTQRWPITTGDYPSSGCAHRLGKRKVKYSQCVLQSLGHRLLCWLRYQIPLEFSKMFSLLLEECYCIWRNSYTAFTTLTLEFFQV